MTIQHAVFGAFIGSLITISIFCWTPKHWWVNRAKRMGFLFAILGITVPVFGYIIGPAFNEYDKIAKAKRVKEDKRNFEEGVELLKKVKASEEGACAKAGLKDPQLYQKRGSVWYWQLTCADKNGVIYEVRTPNCHFWQTEGCR